MNEVPDLLCQPWRCACRQVDDREEIRVETEDGQPVCLVGVTCGDPRADALNWSLARSLAALPRLVRAVDSLFATLRGQLQGAIGQINQQDAQPTLSILQALAGELRELTAAQKQAKGGAG
jgi:hypothetical protein